MTRDLMPGNPELERALCSILITTPDRAGEIKRLVPPGDFHDPRHRAIWQAAQAMNGQAPDLLTLLDFLERRGPEYLKAAGGQSYILDLAADTPPVMLAEQYAHQVAQLARQRRIMQAAAKITETAHRGEIDAALDLARKLPEAEQPAPAGWGWLTLKDAYQDKGPRRYLIGGVLRVPSLSILYGPSGDLKSMLALDLALSVAGGKPWLQPLPDGPEAEAYEVTRAPVLWVDVDQGQDELERRTQALGRTHDLTDDLPFAYVSFPTPAFVASDPAAVELVIATVRASKAELVVLDNLGTISGGADENSNQMVAVMSGLRQIAELGGCAVLVIHHRTKGDSKGRDSLRGHSSIMAALDLALEVTREEGGDTLTLRATKSRAAPVKPFSALWTWRQDNAGELAGGRFFGLGRPTAEALGKQEQAELCILKDMTDGMNQTELVNLVKESAGVGRNTTLAAINALVARGELYPRVGRARGATEYDRTRPV